ncbi:hypothetical protein COEREDRAFT_90482 [Coemansia reversa NRRL 1564]|uniref:Uncharacterized protein n=1 Tax=Coemansia reversa (strain ATCC 12441 / NRRL 1564) TaxID=763665 RepID=A0A2G5BJH0_COERN|nr:hypothetical protein COEREDRAFT_90482 [Coemansia reversa NRRL 1564]|eukprot:PIA19121.1 hypothetical protein COEREDRAFT_90482 [Coemansia reversa NRRL 1564]
MSALNIFPQSLHRVGLRRSLMRLFRRSTMRKSSKCNGLGQFCPNCDAHFLLEMTFARHMYECSG